MLSRLTAAFFGTLILASIALPQSDSLPDAKPIPTMQVVPLPYEQVSFQWNGEEIARYHYGSTLKRPFVFPILGPAGRSLTRMGHPHDQEGHKHHYSFWVSHHDIEGVDFWSEHGEGKIEHREIVAFDENKDEAYTLTKNVWITDPGETLLWETRRIAARPLMNGEWLLIVDLTFETQDNPTTINRNPFGMVGVRMAKTIGVRDGGGTIRNSEGAVNEDDVFRKPAKWVDYSGLITNEKAEGITLFDHPDNPTFPTCFHVRNDGWMGASLTLNESIEVQPDQPLHLRYGLYIHHEVKPLTSIETQWKHFSEIELVQTK